MHFLEVVPTYARILEWKDICANLVGKPFPLLTEVLWNELENESVTNDEVVKYLLGCLRPMRLLSTQASLLMDRIMCVWIGNGLLPLVPEGTSLIIGLFRDLLVKNNIRTFFCLTKPVPLYLAFTYVRSVKLPSDSETGSNYGVWWRLYYHDNRGPFSGLGTNDEKNSCNVQVVCSICGRYLCKKCNQTERKPVLCSVLFKPSNWLVGALFCPWQGQGHT